MMTSGEIIGIWIAAGLTLMMFSFIYRDNVFFKFGEHLYLGISVGYFVNIQYWQVIQPDLIRPLTIEHDYRVLIPAVLGIFIILRLIPSLAWMSRMSFAFYFGGFAGIAIPNVIHGYFLPQLSETLRPFDAGIGGVLLSGALIGGTFYLMARSMSNSELWSGLSAVALISVVLLLTGFGVLSGAVNNQIFILAGVFTVLIFFFFSLEHKGAVGSVSRVGLFFIMVGFGASFGYTVMARISLLIGRFQFLIDDWIKATILKIS